MSNYSVKSEKCIMGFCAEEQTCPSEKTLLTCLFMIHSSVFTNQQHHNIGQTNIAKSTDQKDPSMQHR